MTDDKKYQNESEFKIISITLSILVQPFAVSLVAQIPIGYYNGVTGTGATLKTQLYVINLSLHYNSKYQHFLKFLNNNFKT